MAIVLEYVGYLKHFQILGLFFDIIGAYYLAQSSITKKLEDVVCESFGDENEKYPGGLSDNLGQSLYQQSIEARTGFIILSIGFIFQGVGTLHSSWEIWRFGGTGFIILILATVSIVHGRLFGRDRISKKILNKMEKMSK